MMDLGQAERPVVVGVDGSAALTALWSGRPRRPPVGSCASLGACVLVDDVRAARPPPGPGGAVCEQLLEVARGQVAPAARIAADTRPDVETTTQVEVGAPIEVLGSEARRARLLVLGDRGLGGMAGLVLGSVAVMLAARGACPVVIVRGDRDRTGSGPVVVGIDGSPVSEAAVAFAFEAAAARGVELLAVHAWSATPIDDALAPFMDWEAVAVDEDALLAQRLTGWGQKYPHVTVQRHVVRDGAAHALVECSAVAQLVVVGSRGRGNATGLMLGSVSHGVLHGAHCPVAVVRPGTEG